MKSIKKLLLIFLAVLTAVMMSLSFIACGGNNTPLPDPVVPDDDDPDGQEHIAYAEKAVEALKYLRTVSGFSGEFNVTFDSDAFSGDNAVNETYNIVKRGDMIEVSAAENGTAAKSVVDTKTGYLYMPSDNGYKYDQIMPAYSLDYAMYLAELELETADTDALEESLAYDPSTKTVTYKSDLATTINALLVPLYDDRNTKLEDVVDAYIDMTSAEYDSFDDLYDESFSNIRLFKDQKLGNLISALQMGQQADIYAELRKFGIEFTDDQKSAINSRTVEQAVVALSGYVNNKITEIIASMVNPTDVEDEGQIEPPSNSGSQDLFAVINILKTNCKSVAEQMIQAMLFEPVDESVSYDEAVGNLKNDLDTVLALNKQSVIDIATSKSPMLAFVINNKISFKTLEYGLTLTFDDDYNVARLIVNGKAAHTYTSSESGLAFDNNLNYGAEISVIEYLTDSTQISKPALAPDQQPDNAIALVYGDITQDVKVYIESSTPITVVNIAATLIQAGEEDEDIPFSNGDIVYDAQTKTVAVNAALVRKLFAQVSGAEINIKLYTDEENYVTVTLIRLTDSKTDLLYLLENILANKVFG